MRIPVLPTITAADLERLAAQCGAAILISDGHAFLIDKVEDES